MALNMSFFADKYGLKTVQNYSGVFPTSEMQFPGSEMSKRGRFFTYQYRTRKQT